MGKSPDAFRTISEVADWLGVQAHVLRFWESKFSQVKPVKRAGGRRYYRPNDMLLLGGIRRLLHDDGLTIKGVQKILREEGISHVAALSQPLDDLMQSELDDTPEDIVVAHVPEPEEEKGVVLNFESAAANAEETAEVAGEPLAEAPEAAPQQQDEDIAAAPEPPSVPADDPAQGEEPAQEAPVAEEPANERAAEEPEFHAAEAEVEDENAAALPAFLRRPMAEPPTTDNPPVEAEAAPEPPAPKPRIIDMPPITPLDQIDAGPGVLTAAMRAKTLTPEQARQIAPLLGRLTALRDSMAARRRPGSSD